MSTLDLHRVRTWIARALANVRENSDDRGDVPGWVLVTIMTAGLVVGLWAVAGPRLEAVFTQAMDAVVGQL
ncbi:hypothetical protein OG218_20160 [Kineococcus sp. NBC_00420]